VTALAEAFFLPDANDTFMPTRATVGPWDPELQHGSPPAALLARAIERAGGRDDMRVANISYDFFGTLRLAPMTVRTEIVRPGKRVELWTATALIDGRPALRATAWRIAVGPGRSAIVNIDEPPPAMPSGETRDYFEGVQTFGYGESMEWRFVSGSFREPGPATVWSRMRIPLVPGERPTPLVRALAMVDSANGISWEAEITTTTFVPVNLTVSLTRDASSEWVGMNAVTALAGDGVGTVRARIFDERGVVGEALQCLFVAPR
jgi:hypothetical protein